MLEEKLSHSIADGDSQIVRISQKHLSILEQCPYYFQQIYLEKIPTIVPHELQIKAEWGKCFHLLMQQRELGLEIEPLLQENLEMKSSIEALLEVTKDIFDRKTKVIREAEHSRTFYLNGYLLTVVYDLLVLATETAQIIDWKTYLQPENTQKLANNWQNRLYLYALVETSNYEPEQISFTYWFVKLPQEPQKVTFQYNSQMHRQNHRDLTDLLSKLDRWLQDYFNRNIPFPRCANCRKNCPIDRNSVSTLEASDNPFTIDDIAEVCLDL
jgi:hypothetical protein